MQITFDIPHVFHPGADPVENGEVLAILLDALIRLDVQFLKRHSVPNLYRSGVVYGRTTVWDTIPALYAKGFGDCKTVTAALIAERAVAGESAKPVFRWTRNPDGTTDYHILVQTPEGFKDPSKVLGMNNENSHFRRA